MRNVILCTAALILVSIVNSCNTSPAVVEPRAANPAITTLAYDLQENGLYHVEVSINNTGSYNFIIDTGATISTIFESTAVELGLSTLEAPQTNVYGLVERSLRPVITLDNLNVGTIQVNDLSVVVLNDREPPNNADGILGMDFLKNYAVLIDHKTKSISLYPPENYDRILYAGMKMIPLRSNPYIDDDYNLHYINILLSGFPTPAIFDLGSSISIVNIEAAKGPSVYNYKSKLRERWELEGAVGAFSPAFFARYWTIRSNDYTWYDWTVFVTEIDSLEILNTEGKPLMIAGADLFRDTSLFIDFSRNRLYIQPSELHSNERERPPRMRQHRRPDSANRYE